LVLAQFAARFDWRFVADSCRVSPRSAAGEIRILDRHRHQVCKIQIGGAGLDFALHDLR